MIFTIFKKELKDTLRDRRTLMMMIVIPVLIFPIIMNVFVGISSSFQEEAATKALGTGFQGGIGWQDIEVSRTLAGAPLLYFHRKAYEKLNDLILKIIS